MIQSIPRSLLHFVPQAKLAWLEPILVLRSLSEIIFDQCALQIKQLGQSEISANIIPMGSFSSFCFNLKGEYAVNMHLQSSKLSWDTHVPFNCHEYGHNICCFMELTCFSFKVIIPGNGLLGRNTDIENLNCISNVMWPE